MRVLIFLILLFLTSFSSQVFAQKKGYDWGYIITERGDTVEGWISDRATGSFSDFHGKLRFKREGKLFKNKYAPDDILGYGYLGVHFVSLPLVESSRLFKTSYLLRNGADRIFLRVVERNECLNHYEIEFIQDDSFIILSYPVFHKPGSREMVRITQGVLGLKKKRLSEYFSDCNSLLQAIDSQQITTLQEVYDFYCDKCR